MTLKDSLDGLRTLNNNWIWEEPLGAVGLLRERTRYEWPTSCNQHQRANTEVTWRMFSYHLNFKFQNLIEICLSDLKEHHVGFCNVQPVTKADFWRNLLKPIVSSWLCGTFSAVDLGFLVSCNWERLFECTVKLYIYKFIYQQLPSSARVECVTLRRANVSISIWKSARLLAHLGESMNYLTVIWTLLSFYWSPSISILLGSKILDPISHVPSPQLCVTVLPEFPPSLASTWIY